MRNPAELANWIWNCLVAMAVTMMLGGTLLLAPRYTTVIAFVTIVVGFLSGVAMAGGPRVRG